ncbi:MAG: hypothetical protein ABGY11_00930 [Candidatus Thioglobus sp.]|jgi:hypothetical protein
MKPKSASVIHLAEGREWVYICEIPELIAIVQEPDDESFKSRVTRIALEEAHMEGIKKAVKNGTLITRNQYSHIPEPFAVGARLRGSVISVNELRGYVSDLELTVEVNKPPICKGRYTIEDAAFVMADGLGEETRALVEKITTAVANNNLKLYRPGSIVPYEPLKILPYNDELYWDELNEWIEKELPRIGWRFPNPKHGPDAFCIATHQVAKRTVSSDTFSRGKGINGWLYQTWEKEGRPNASDFFRRLNNYVEVGDSPIISRVTTTGCETFTFKTKRMKTNKTWKLKTLQNKISDFKKQPKQ